VIANPYSDIVFLNSPHREKPQNVLKQKSRKKKSAGGWVGLGFSKYTGGSVDFVLPAPRERERERERKREKERERERERGGREREGYMRYY
jgi:hypothetical protein